MKLSVKSKVNMLKYRKFMDLVMHGNLCNAFFYSEDIIPYQLLPEKTYRDDGNADY